VSAVAVVSGGLEPQNVSVNAKAAHKTVAKATFNDFFMISGLNLAFIPKTLKGHPIEKQYFYWVTLMGNLYQTDFAATWRIILTN
jgi:hypothetical protein